MATRKKIKVEPVDSSHRPIHKWKVTEVDAVEPIETENAEKIPPEMADDQQEKAVTDEIDGMIDCTEAFTTDKKFQNHRELFNWARLVGEKNGFVVTTAKSSYGKKVFLKLGCERRGKYQPYIGKSTDRSPRSKKCDCPFMLLGKPKKGEGNCWFLQVKCGLHNHARSKSVLNRKGLVEDKVRQTKRAPLKEEQSLELKFKSALDALSLKFEQADVPTKKRILEKLEELAFTDSTVPTPSVPKWTSPQEQSDMSLLDTSREDGQYSVPNCIRILKKLKVKLELDADQFGYAVELLRDRQNRVVIISLEDSLDGLADWSLHKYNLLEK